MANNDITNNINRGVINLVKPIIDDMTKINFMQQNSPSYAPYMENKQIDEIKKRCVHIIEENGEFKIAAKKNVDGDFICAACGRKLYTKFDKTAVDRIMDAIEVCNQLVLFGMLNRLSADALSSIISLKTTLPSVATLVKELNERVSRENNAIDETGNIGMEYATPNAFRSITSYR